VRSAELGGSSPEPWVLVPGTTEEDPKPFSEWIDVPTFGLDWASGGAPDPLVSPSLLLPLPPRSEASPDAAPVPVPEPVEPPPLPVLPAAPAALC
jgi:hypothetical protein